MLVGGGGRVGAGGGLSERRGVTGVTERRGVAGGAGGRLVIAPCVSPSGCVANVLLRGDVSS